MAAALYKILIFGRIWLERKPTLRSWEKQMIMTLKLMQRFVATRYILSYISNFWYLDKYIYLYLLQFFYEMTYLTMIK